MSIRDTFTEIGTGVIPSSIILRRKAQACSQTYSSRLVIKPFFSNTGMNFAGEISPFTG